MPRRRRHDVLLHLAPIHRQLMQSGASGTGRHRRPLARLSFRKIHRLNPGYLKRDICPGDPATVECHELQQRNGGRSKFVLGYSKLTRCTKLGPDSGRESGPRLPTDARHVLRSTERLGQLDQPLLRATDRLSGLAATTGTRPASERRAPPNCLALVTHHPRSDSPAIVNVAHYNRPFQANVGKVLLTKSSLEPIDLFGSD